MKREAKRLYLVTQVAPTQRSGGWHGMCATLVCALSHVYANTEVIVCRPSPVSKWDRWRHYFKKIADGCGHVSNIGLKHSKLYASRIKSQVQSKNGQILSFGTPLVACLNKEYNYSILTDAFAEDLACAFGTMSDSETRRLHSLDKMALANCSKLIVLTERTRQTAIHKYGYPETQVLRLGGFAFLEELPEVAIEILKEPRFKLLFIAMDWKRRNGDFAVSLHQQLRTFYPHLELHLSGESPPHYVLDLPGIVFHTVDKSSMDGPRRLAQIYRQCDFLISPAYHDLGSAVILEAALFGVPALAWDSSGATENIQHNVSGFLIHHTDSIMSWVANIQSLYSDMERFNTLRQTTRRVAIASSDPADKAKEILTHLQL